MTALPITAGSARTEGFLTTRSSLATTETQLKTWLQKGCEPSALAVPAFI
jgi:hypothetical protein